MINYLITIKQFKEKEYVMVHQDYYTASNAASALALVPLYLISQEDTIIEITT